MMSGRYHRMRVSAILATVGLLLTLVGCGLGESTGSRMEKAAADLDAGRYRSAEIHLKNVLQNEPSNGRARLLLGRLSLATTRYEDAAEQLQRALDAGVPAKEVGYSLARALIGAGRFEDALVVLADQPSENAFDAAAIASLRGDASLGLGRADDAANAYAQALEVQPEFPAALVGQARLAQLDDDLQSASELLGRALQVSPNFLPALEARAGLAYSDGRCAEATTDFKHIVDLPATEVSRVQRFVARAFLSDCQLQLRDFAPAEENIAILIQEGAQNPYANYLQSLVSIRHEDYDAATTHLQRLLKASPQNPRGLTLLASVKMAQGDYELAEVYLNETLARTPGNRSALRMLASLQLKQGRPEAAVERLQDALARTPGDPGIRAMLAEALVSAGDSQSALEFAVGGRDGQVNGGWPIGLAARMIDAGDSEAAAALLDTVDLGNSENRLRAGGLRVVLLIKEGKTEEAVAQAEALVERNPDSAVLVRVLASTYVAAARLSDAQKVLENGLSAHPGDEDFQLALGLVSMRQGDAQKARLQLEPLADGNGNTSAKLAMARLEGMRGDSDAALAWLESAHVSQPESRLVSISLIRAYLSAGRAEQAVAVTQKLTTDQPDDAELRHLSGVTLLAAGKTDEGITDLARATELNADSRDYRMDLVSALLGVNRPDAASEQLKTVRERFPNFAPAFVAQAMMQLRQGDAAAALVTADELARTPDGNVAAEELKGSIHAAQGEFAAAAKAYDRARELNPTQTLTFKVFEARRRAGANDAGVILREWLTEHPSDLELQLVLAQWLEKTGQVAEASDAYEIVIAGEPNNLAALNNLALLYAEDKSERALQLAERAHELVPDNPAVTDTLGWLVLRTGDRPRGLALIREAADAAPGVLEIQYHLAFALAGSTEDADRAEAREIVSHLLASEETGDSRTRAQKLSEMLAASGGGAGG